MNYTVLETHCIYRNGKLAELAVLWESNPNLGLVRATSCTVKPCQGYLFLLPTDTISDELIQRVAGQGANLQDTEKAKYFPGERKWER